MDLFLIKELFRETSLDIASIVFIFGIFVIMGALLRVMFYEAQINKIEKQKEKEIDGFRTIKGVNMDYLTANIKKITEKYQYDLDKLNRGRKFILEKLPFFKN